MPDASAYPYDGLIYEFWICPPLQHPDAVRVDIPEVTLSGTGGKEQIPSSSRLVVSL